MPTLGDFLTFNAGAGFNDNKIIFQQLFGNNDNIMNPFLIGNTVLYDDKGGNPLNMIVQNWMTNDEKAEIVTYDRFSGPGGQGQGGQGQGGQGQGGQGGGGMNNNIIKFT